MAGDDGVLGRLCGDGDNIGDWTGDGDGSDDNAYLADIARLGGTQGGTGKPCRLVAVGWTLGVKPEVCGASGWARGGAGRLVGMDWGDGGASGEYGGGGGGRLRVCLPAGRASGDRTAVFVWVDGRVLQNKCKQNQITIY